MSAEPLTLTEAELFELTGYKRAKQQKRYFDGLGVPSTPRADGSLCVVRAHLLNLRPIAANDANGGRRVKRVR